MQHRRYMLQQRDMSYLCHEASGQTDDASNYETLINLTKIAEVNGEHTARSANRTLFEVTPGRELTIDAI